MYAARTIASALSLVMLAGTATAMQDTKQPDPRQQERRQQDSQRDDARQTTRDRNEHGVKDLALVTASSLIGIEVTNANGEDLGTVEDAILDRGSGQVRYLILNHGGVLGIGGDQVAIRMTEFSTGPDRKGLVLRSTPERLDREAEFDADDWASLDSEDWRDDLNRAWREMTRDDDRGNTDAGTGVGSTVGIEGTITEVNRVDDDWGTSEHVVVVIEGDKEKAHRVNLGPSWFVLSQNTVPMRGDKIEVEAFRTNSAQGSDTNPTLRARSVTINGSNMVFRDASGRAAWQPKNEADGRSTSDPLGGDAAGQSHDRYAVEPLMMLSDLVGMPTSVREDDSGSIDDAIIELRSGRVALLVVDPNEAFLGIGDTTRLVPWSVASVGPETVRIDADVSMLTAAPEMPDDITTMSRAGSMDPVYRVYRVQSFHFMPMVTDSEPRGQRKVTRNQDDRLQRDRQNDRDRDRGVVEVNGSIASIQSEMAPDGQDKQVTLVVQTSDGVKRVVLGHRDKLDRKGIELKQGDLVVIRGTAMDKDGRKVIMARSIKVSNGERITLVEDGSW